MNAFSARPRRCLGHSRGNLGDYLGLGVQARSLRSQPRSPISAVISAFRVPDALLGRRWRRRRQTPGTHPPRVLEAGLVAVAPQERRKSTLYMVSERVFRIWHQMRFTVAKRRLQFLVDFLRVWYTPVEVADRAAAQAKAVLSRVHRAHRLFSDAAYAIENRAYDRGRALFNEALDHASLASEDLVQREIAEFFGRVAREETAALCAGLFEMMRQREMERELGLVAPFAHAVEFWQRGKDPEVLDRLNPA